MKWKIQPSTAQTHGALHTHNIPLALTQQIPKNVQHILITALTISASLKLEKNTKAASPVTKLLIHLLFNSSTRLIPKNAWMTILTALLPFVKTHFSRTWNNALNTIAKQMLISALMMAAKVVMISNSARLPTKKPIHQLSNSFPQVVSWNAINQSVLKNQSPKIKI